METDVARKVSAQTNSVASSSLATAIYVTINISKQNEHARMYKCEVNFSMSSAGSRIKQLSTQSHIVRNSYKPHVNEVCLVKARISYRCCRLAFVEWLLETVSSLTLPPAAGVNTPRSEPPGVADSSSSFTFDEAPLLENSFDRDPPPVLEPLLFSVELSVRARRELAPAETDVADDDGPPW